MSNGTLILKQMLSPILILSVAKRGTCEQPLPLTDFLAELSWQEQAPLEGAHFKGSAGVYPGGILGRRPNTGFRLPLISRQDPAAKRLIQEYFLQQQLPRECNPKELSPPPIPYQFLLIPAQPGRFFAPFFHPEPLVPLSPTNQLRKHQGGDHEQMVV